MIEAISNSRMTTNTENGSESESSSSYNPKLDFFSDKFDPLLALNTPGLIVPVLTAKTYDNIYQYQSAHSEKKATQNPQKKQSQEIVSVQRHWKPHQLPVKVERKVKKKKNVFTAMEEIAGPLSLLRKCRDEHLKIKIVTRHSHGIRGYCLAYIVAFDTHWNLALMDVDEVWTRRKKRKVPALGDQYNVPLHYKPKIFPPKITIVESSKKSETCKRHIDQLLLRGEHVAYISVIK